MKIISTDKAPAAIGPYSQAVVTGNLVYASGQIPVIPSKGTLAEGDITVQAEQACKNVGTILAAAGTSFEKVVKTTCFIADINDFALISKPFFSVVGFIMSFLFCVLQYIHYSILRFVFLCNCYNLSELYLVRPRIY